MLFGVEFENCAEYFMLSSSVARADKKEKASSRESESGIVLFILLPRTTYVVAMSASDTATTLATMREDVRLPWRALALVGFPKADRFQISKRPT